MANTAGLDQAGVGQVRALHSPKLFPQQRGPPSAVTCQAHQSEC